MALIVSSYAGSRNISKIVNRTGASGGSIGGDKKAGIFGGNVFMRIQNQGNHGVWRLPHKTPTKSQLIIMTTHHPVQYRRGSYSLTHSATM